MTYDELIRLIRRTDSVEEIDRHRDEIIQLIPVFGEMIDAQTCYCGFSLWYHALNTVTSLPRNCRDDMLYLAALLHDVGKSGTLSFGHAQESKVIVETRVLPGLIQSGEDIAESEKRRLLYYIEHHEDHLGMDVQDVLSCMGNVSRDLYRKLMLLEAADSVAYRKDPDMLKREEVCLAVAGLLHGRTKAL